MISIIFAGALALLNPEPQTIWQNITVGMTRSEVETLYPEYVPHPTRAGRRVFNAYHMGNSISPRHAVEVIPGCEGDVMIYHENGVVTGVKLTVAGCNNIHPRLVGRYGAPDTTTVEMGSLGIERPSQMTKYVWHRDGLVITNFAGEIKIEVAQTGDLFGDRP